MSSELPQFPYGASYSPLVYPEAEWSGDLAAMRDAGMNLIRVGDVHGSWDRIEPRRGEFQFEKLARFYKTAQEHGLWVILSTGTSCPPLWLVTRHPDVSIVSSRGESYPLAASYHWACIHHPAFVEESDRYTEALASFAVQQPNHFGWQISNEIGFPFMPTRERDMLDLYCYCPHCRAEFQTWVREKYGTLEAVSEAWMWSTTAFWYNDWAEVNPPEALPSAWSGVTRWIDWRLFWQKAFARFARRQHEAIRRIDTEHPTSINTFNFKGYDRFGTYTGLDQWQIAQQVDHIGYDLYPGSGNKLSSRPEHSSIFLDHGRSVSQSAGSAFWLHEMESGPIGGWLLGPEYNTGAVDIWRNGLEALGHNVKLILYMPWREWDYQPLHWGALVDLDGSPTPRLAAASELGHYIRGNDEFLRSAQVPLGEVALLESKPNAIFLKGIGQEELLFTAQRGAYRAAWELGYRVDFITPAQVASREIDHYKAVMLPLLGLIDLETAEGLRRYVDQGGLLVTFARCGSFTERGWYHRQVPPGGLAAALGLTGAAPDGPGTHSVRYQDTTFTPKRSRDLFSLLPGTEVLASFDDGYPAVTLAQLGAGQGLAFAAHADSEYLAGDGGLLKSVFADVMRKLGIQPQVRLSVEGITQRALDPHLLEGPGRTTILIANYLTRDTSATLHLKAMGRQVAHIERGFGNKERITWSQEQDNITIELNTKKEVGEALDIFWRT